MDFSGIEHNKNPAQVLDHKFNPPKFNLEIFNTNFPVYILNKAETEIHFISDNPQ